jgi:hypothetical protein
MVIFTALKHFAQHQKHIRYHAMVKNTNAYKKKRSEMLQASGALFASSIALKGTRLITSTVRFGITCLQG